jgi:GT2 family glycosyltransferase
LVLDEPTEEECVVNMMSEMPINCQVIVNNQDHSWRPPCKAINVGIRHAKSDVIAVMSPESILRVPSEKYFNQCIDEVGGIFYTGFFSNLHLGERINEDAYRRVCHPYGFLMARKESLEAIGGYDELRTGYGGDDDDVYGRLRNLGVQRVQNPNLRIFHILGDKETAPRGPSTVPHGVGIKVNDDYWGTSFNRVALDRTISD